MLHTLKAKLFQDRAVRVPWPCESENTLQSQSGRPLHLTLFSPHSIPSARWYDKFPEVPDLGDQAAVQEYIGRIDELVARKAKALSVRFYEDKWFQEHRYRIRAYAQFCQGLAGQQDQLVDYAVSDTKVLGFLQHRIAEKKAEDPNTTPFTLFNLLRKNIPVLERIAEWQGYDELASGIWALGDIRVLAEDLKRKMAESIDEATVDYASTDRHETKRLSEDEDAAMTTAIWTSSVHKTDKIVMRSSLQHSVNRVLGRRGMDIRQVRQPAPRSQYSIRFIDHQVQLPGAPIYASRGFNRQG
jgi:hypothetical protein